MTPGFYEYTYKGITQIVEVHFCLGDGPVLYFAGCADAVPLAKAKAER